MHVIDDGSPLKDKSADSLNAAATVFILSLSGTDVTTEQVRDGYRAEYSRTPPFAGTRAFGISWRRTTRGSCGSITESSMN